MKKGLIIILAVLFCVGVATPSAFAGSPQRHRWEGVAIGVGAAIVGSAILGNVLNPHTRVVHHTRPRHHYRPARIHHRPAVYTRPARPVTYRPAPPPRSCGHWEVQKVWVEPVYQRVWNPGHYDAHQNWVPGHYIKIEKQPGYWKEERVWVTTR